MSSMLISRYWPVSADTFQADAGEEMDAGSVEQALRRIIGDLGNLHRTRQLTPDAVAKVAEARRALEEARQAQRAGA